MKKIIRKIIIWLFERYAFDSWSIIQQRTARDEFRRKYNLEEDEIDQAMIDMQQEPLKDAYDAGKMDGYDDVNKLTRE